MFNIYWHVALFFEAHKDCEMLWHQHNNRVNIKQIQIWQNSLLKKQGELLTDLFLLYLDSLR